MSAPAGSSCANPSSDHPTRWPLERALFAIAGTVVLIGALLTVLVSQWFLLLVVFVAFNQWLFVLAGDCPMSLILTRAFGLRRGVQR